MKQQYKKLDICVKFKIALLSRGQASQTSAFVAKKVEQLLTLVDNGCCVHCWLVTFKRLSQAG